MFSFIVFVLVVSKGTGTLGIPYAVMQGGYLSLAAIILIAVISNYTGKLIIECLYDKPIEGGRRGTRQRRSYAQIGKTRSFTGSAHEWMKP